MMKMKAQKGDYIQLLNGYDKNEYEVLGRFSEGTDNSIGIRYDFHGLEYNAYDGEYKIVKKQ